MKIKKGHLEQISDFKGFLNDNDIQTINIKLDYLELYKTLPKHHKDPFDHLIIATAMIENIPLISYDHAFKYYDGLKLLH